MAAQHHDVVIVGGGLAGIVTALEALRAGQSVALVDRDAPERLGGLALWAFGGMALVGTALQARMKIPDSPEAALRDWVRFGEMDPADTYPQQWARYYVEHSRAEVYDWLLGEGVKFMPAVNWIERGRHGEGNSVPRYHIIWGTARELTRRMIAAMRQADTGGRLTVLHRHRASALDLQQGRTSGVLAVNEDTGAEVRLTAAVVVLAMGGINGGHAQTRANWPTNHPLPATLLNGAHPFADGAMHHHAADRWGAQITHAGEMWNYAAGFPHPFPHFEGHGLSTIPCKSALWLNWRGERIGPMPLVTGFDTHDLVGQICRQERAYSWQLLNRRIMLKELAISGGEFNPAFRRKSRLAVARDMVFGNHWLYDQLTQFCPDVVVAPTVETLVEKMNVLAGDGSVDIDAVRTAATRYDDIIGLGPRFHTDDQLRRIEFARRWIGDRLRTCKFQQILEPAAGPLIAIREFIISRKSMGGLQTCLLYTSPSPRDRTRSRMPSSA